MFSFTSSRHRALAAALGLAVTRAFLACAAEPASDAPPAGSDSAAPAPPDGAAGSNGTHTNGTPANGNGTHANGNGTPANGNGTAANGNGTQNITVTAEGLNKARASIQTQTGASTYTIDADAIQAIPGGDNAPLNQVLLRAPGVVQDSFGQLHIRGEHNGLQYRLNGIILPEGISVFSQTLDPRLIQSLQLVTGALPAQYGLRTAGIVDLTTRSGHIDAYTLLSIYGGSRGQVQPSVVTGGAAGNFSYFVSLDFLRNDLGIESPDGSADPLHDHTKQYHGFAYLEQILSDNDRLAAVLGTAHAEYQIPNRFGQTPALGLTVDGQTDFPSEALDENQTEITQYLIVSYQHSGDNFDAQTSFGVRYSSLTFFPDPNLGDLLFNGISQNAYKRDTAYNWQTDTAIHLGSAHILRTGFYLQYDEAVSNTTSQVLPVDEDGMQLPGSAPLTVLDNTSHSQEIASIYVQDEWRVMSQLTVNYGLRFDHLAAYTTGHQVSPRLNAVWKPLDGLTVHSGYSHYFSPPPFELVGLSDISKLFGTSAAPAVQRADPPLPEEANYYSLGAEQVLGHFTVGLDTYYKQSRNLIDEGQFGAPIILTPFNYRYGKQYGEELTLAYAVGGLNTYASLAGQRALGKDIISSQFSFDPDELAYIASHYIHLDHEQQFTASAGASYRWAGTLVSADILIGSGLRADLILPGGSSIPNGTHLPYYAQVNVGASHSFAHWTPGSSLPGPTVRLDLINLFDSVYEIRNGTGVGVGAPQYGPRRGIFVGIEVPL